MFKKFASLKSMIKLRVSLNLNCLQDTFNITFLKETFAFTNEIAHFPQASIFHLPCLNLVSKIIGVIQTATILKWLTI